MDTYTGASPVTKYLEFCLSVSRGQKREQKRYRGTTVAVGFCMCELYNVIWTRAK
jgi:hypothetical protein